MLRVRHDVAARMDVSDATIIGNGDDRVHFAIDPLRRGDCEPVALQGIFLLNVADRHRVEEVRPSDAIRKLWPLASRFPSRRGTAQCFEDLADVIRRVPVWNLFRPLQFDELPRTMLQIEQTVRS
jgi:hypothetical protein